MYRSKELQDQIIAGLARLLTPPFLLDCFIVEDSSDESI